MNGDTLFGLLRNAFLLLSLGVLYDLIPLKPRSNKTVLQILVGFILGLIGITIMSSPWIFVPGITFDTRSVLISVSGLFFSPISTLIATVMTILMRLYIGGGGTVMGISVILTSAALGLAWRRLRPQKSKPYSLLELYLFGIVVHIAMILWMFSLPRPSVAESFRRISLPVMLIYPIATVLLGNLLSHQENRKVTSQQLRESEENLRQVLQNMPVMLDAFDEYNNIIVWNRECERVTGYTAGEVVNNPQALSLLYPDPQQRRQLEENLAAANQKFIAQEWDMTAKDGSLKTISWVSRADEVSIPGWHTWAIGVDVTTRVQALRALEKSEAQYRRIVETAEEGIWMINAANKTVFVNHKIADLLGYGVDEMIGADLFDFLDERGVAAAQANLERRRQGIHEQYDFRFKHKDGHDLWTLLSTSPIIGKDGKYQGALGMLTDITARRKNEEELREYRNRLQKTQEIGQVGSWEFDLASGHIWGSDQGFAIYGLTPPPDNELPVDLIESFIPEREMVHQALVDLINEEKPYNLEFEVRPPNGKFTIITSMAELIKDEHGKPVKVAGVIQDITERKLAELEIHKLNTELEVKVAERTAQLQNANEALESALRARDTFLANMSHELRTPLTAILGLSEILEEQIRGPLNEKQLHFVQNIYSSGQHLLNLINDVLDLSKIEAHQMQLDWQDVILEDVCEASLAFIQTQTAEKNIQVQSSRKTSRTNMQADVRRLKQILINLLSNAVKFTPQSGTIGLEVQDDPNEPGWVKFTVWDTGIGIAAEDQQNLFQPFIQVDAKLNRQYEGTGLGLVLVARFTELHNGKVSLESQPGKGTRVTVRLPYRQEK